MAGYLRQLAELLQKQTEQKNEAMHQMAQSEERWMSVLQSTSRALQRQSGSGVGTAEFVDASSSGEEDMAVDASAAADASRQVAVEHSHQQETALMQALQAASAAAVVQEEEYRERTPRRRKDKNKGPAPEAEVKPEPAETPDPAKPGDTPVLTGKALQPFGLEALELFAPKGRHSKVQTLNPKP